MPTQNLITTPYPATWTAEQVPNNWGFVPDAATALKSGGGLLYYSNLGGTLNDRDTEFDVYFEVAGGVDHTTSTRLDGDHTAGDETIAVDAGVDFEVGDIVWFEDHDDNYEITKAADYQIDITPGLLYDEGDNDRVFQRAACNDVGVAIFDDVTEDAELGIILAITRESGVDVCFVMIYDGGSIYHAKYKDGANYRTIAKWLLSTDSMQETKNNFMLRLTSNRYLKLYQNGTLLELTANSLGANVTTVDIQNIYYGAGNTQYVPDASGFYVGVSSGAINRYQATDHYSYLDNIRVRQ